MTYQFDNIDFETPQFVIHHYYISGSIAIAMNTFVFYLILYRSGKIDSFKYYLMLFQFACSLCDLHLSFLMQPIPLFPMVAGYCEGVLATYFQLTPHVLMTILAFCVGFQVNALNACFLRKHQAIALLTNKNLLSRRTYHICLLFFACYTFSFGVTFFFSNYSKDEEYQIIERDYSLQRSKFEKLKNFAVYDLNKGMIASMLLIIVGCIQSTMTVNILVFQMHQNLVKCGANLSKTTMEKHKSAIKSLLCQFLTTPIGILPAMLIISTIFIRFEGAQVFTWYMLMTMATHSTINCIVVILTYPEFRAFVFFWSKRAKQQRHRKSVSFLVRSGNTPGNSRMNR